MYIENNALVRIYYDDLKDNTLVIPQGVEKIENSVCENNPRIQNLYLPSSLKKIGNKAFLCCRSLENVYFYKNEEDIEKIKEGNDFNIEYIKECNNVEEIGTFAFGNTNITNFVFSPALKILRTQAFYNSKIKNAYFFNETNIKEFDNNAFEECDKLKEINLPKSVVNIINLENDNGVEKFVLNSTPKILIGYECERIKKEKMLINNDINELNPIHLQNLQAMSSLFYKNVYLSNYNDETNVLIVKDKNRLVKLNEYDLYIFCLEEMDYLNRGYGGVMYSFKKMFNKYKFKEDIPACLINMVKNEQEIEDYFENYKNNKIWRKIEKSVKAFTIVNKLNNDYLKGMYKIAYMLGVFDRDPQIKQKASDFIYSNILTKNGGDYTFSKFLMFSKISFFKNEKTEEVLKFIKDNLKKIHELYKNNETSIKISNYFEFIDFINQEFYNVKEACKNAKTEFTYEIFVNMFKNRKIKDLNAQNIDIYNELKKYPLTEQKHIDLVYSIKKEMEKNKIPQNAFENYKEGDLENLYNESKLKDKLVKRDKNGNIYIWLNKHKTRNLTYTIDDRTGCGNIFNCGFGIVAVGMKQRDSQNLRILNKYGDGIARATVHVNKQDGTMLYNTFMVYNHSLMNYETLSKLCDTFKNATVAFIKEYEKNNPDCPKIKRVQVGSSFNGLMTVFMNENYKIGNIIKGYTYNLYVENDNDVLWKGDWAEEQYIFMEREEIEKLMNEENLEKKDEEKKLDEKEIINISSNNPNTENHNIIN